MTEPRRADFGPLDDYYAAWYLWRALRRDDRLTDAELDAQYGAIRADIERSLS